MATTERRMTTRRRPGLRYVSDDEPGFRRQRRGRGFSYTDTRGRPLRSPAHLARIRALAIPPAWIDVWICADPLGHLQATGRDARGRKQYRYHDRWREHRDAVKFDRMLEFGRKLPAIRRRVGRDLGRRGLPREKVLAAVVSLLDLTLVRVGNGEYARENGSYGLTTLRDRHADVRGSRIRLRFKGKSGKQHEIHLRDERLARIVKRCQDLPGQNLFRYEDDEGAVSDVTSEDVNAYLREITGEDFTAKDFRTWAGTVLAACALAQAGECRSRRQAERKVAAAVKEVAEVLANTPAVCRSSYIHPGLVDAYLEGSLPDDLGSPRPLDAESLRDLRTMERHVLAFLAGERQAA